MKRFELIINIFIVFILLVIAFKLGELYTTHQRFERLTFTSNERINFDNFNYSVISLEESLNGSYFIVDVREPEEFNRMHLKGAINIRQGEIFRDYETFRFLQNISKNKTIAFYCYQNLHTELGDGRSGSSANFLNDNGINAVVIDGGIEEFMNFHNLLFENKSYDIYELSDWFIDNSNSRCVARFERERTDLITLNNVIEFNLNSAFMTLEEWNNMLDTAGQNTCFAECFDRGSCFYANIFGMRLNNQGGEYEGYILK